MKVPKIIIKEDLEKEIELFSIGLHSETWKKDIIYRNFPKLGEMLGKTKDEKDLLKRFILDYKEKHKDKIKDILADAKKSFDNAEGYLIKLAELMDYTWSENPKDYIAIPVILPYSPYNYKNNSFCFSILGIIWKSKEAKDPLEIALHEISRLMLHEKVGKMVDFNAFYDFKEKIADEALSKIFNNSKGKLE